MGTTLRRTVSIFYKTLTEKGIVKKHAEHLRRKKETIKDEIYPEVQLKKRDIHRSETTVNSPVTANSQSQNISEPSPQKQLRKQINNVPKSANDALIEHKSEENNPRSSSGNSDWILF